MSHGSLCGYPRTYRVHSAAEVKGEFCTLSLSAMHRMLETRAPGLRPFEHQLEQGVVPPRGAPCLEEYRRAPPGQAPAPPALHTRHRPVSRGVNGGVRTPLVLPAKVPVISRLITSQSHAPKPPCVTWLCGAGSLAGAGSRARPLWALVGSLSS